MEPALRPTPLNECDKSPSKLRHAAQFPWTIWRSQASFSGITPLISKRYFDGPEIAPAYWGKDVMQQSAQLLDYYRLEPGSVLDVETRSRHYRIECLGGDSVRISGHPQLCPEPVAARLEGSLNHEG